MQKKYNIEDFRAIGVSFDNATLEVRERVTLNEGEAREFLLKLREVLSLHEALVVSTCNRTEIYYSSDCDLKEAVISLLAAHKGLRKELIQDCFQSLDTNSAINHIFSVSLGLASQVLGDIQISNQVKRAYQVSADMEMAGPFLHRLMHTIFYANKRVVQETRLQDGNASVASVAVDLTKRFVKNIAGAKVLLIGLGEIGQNALENLKPLNLSVTLMNRTKSKAEKLVAEPNVSVADLPELEQAIKESDVVISSVASDERIIHAEHFQADEPYHKLLIDLSVPRSISPDTANIPGVSLYNVDQLTERAKKARKIRNQSVPGAKSIIKEAMIGLDRWKTEMGMSPVINKLKNVLDQIRKEELLRHASKISDQEMELLEAVTKNMIQKVIKLPILQIKAACKRGESETLVGLLNDLFRLDPGQVKED